MIANSCPYFMNINKLFGDIGSFFFLDINFCTSLTQMRYMRKTYSLVIISKTKKPTKSMITGKCLLADGTKIGDLTHPPLVIQA